MKIFGWHSHNNDRQWNSCNRADDATGDAPVLGGRDRPAQMQAPSDGGVMPLSLADLKRQGQFLGAGQNGGAYRLGERVLKVLHAPDDFLFNKPTRTARYWNEFHGADEETWLLVTARAVRLADGTPALDTPFIETAARKPYQPELRSIEKKLKQRGLKLHYVNVPGNVVVSRGGKAVLTDFDMARHIDADSAGGDEIKALRKGKLPPPWNPRWG